MAVCKMEVWEMKALQPHVLLQKKKESMTFETEINEAFLIGISYKYLQGAKLR